MLANAPHAVAKELPFRSEKGFLVEYPDSWVRLPGTPQELEILSTRHRVEGAVIPRDGAEIIVREISPRPGESLGTFLQNEYHVNVTNQERVPVSAGRHSSCGSLARVSATFEIGPKAVQQQTFFLCKIGQRSFLTVLTAWQGEHVSQHWEQVARRIASSVKRVSEVKR
jgi:hypothetical protein